jgi:glycosyltransferase involved in cell wall biosynthesis
MMEFWDSIDYNKARKVLVIPNITNSSNIEKDSFIDVIYNHIKALEPYGEYFWNVLIPTDKVTKKLNLPNVKQHQIDIAGDMMNQRAFPSDKLISILQNVEYDVVYSHLPDWPQVGRYIKWNTKIIGYSHWFEGSKHLPCNGVDRRDGKAKWLWLPVELLGISQMETCYVNTHEQKHRVLLEAKEIFNDEFVSKLDNIIRVWHLGVEKSKIVDNPSETKRNIIVFNHRAAAYKGYPKFLELMREFRQIRQDFVVWIPQLAGKSPETWIDNSKLPKHEYYYRLRDCKVGVQMRQSNYGWSVSATDCMMNGTPMVWQESDCYKEIEPNGIFWKNKKDFFEILNKILDDDEHRKDLEYKAISRAHELSTNENEMIKELHKKLND